MCKSHAQLDIAKIPEHFKGNTIKLLENLGTQCNLLNCLNTVIVPSAEKVMKNDVMITYI